MKRILWLLLILLVLCGVLYYLINQDDKSLATSNDRLFAVEDIGSVHKIFIASRNGDPITLTRKKGHWLLNNRHRVQQRVIDGTLESLKNLELSYIPTKAAYDGVMKELATRGLKVEVYNASEEKIRSFYIGGTSQDGYATAMVVEGRNQPYMMRVSGFLGDLRPQFEKQMADWRDRQIFRDIGHELDTLRIIYPRNRNESFILSRSLSTYQISPAFVTTKKSSKKLNQNVVERYLYDVEKMVMEGYTNDNPKRDSLSQILPFASVYIKKKNGEKRHINFIPYRRRSREIANTGQDLFYARNIERYFIFTSEGDMMLGQQQVLNNIYWGYFSFFN